MNAITLAPRRLQGEVVGNGFFLETNPFKLRTMRYVEGVADGAALSDYIEAARKLVPRAYHDHLQVWVG
jgi:hypothetical protein